MKSIRAMCFGSKPPAQPTPEEDGELAKQRSKNREIDEQIVRDRKRMAKEVKLLLLGAGESGKSTVLKQMRLIHQKGFSLAERKQWKATIFQNLVHAFLIVFGAMEEQEVAFADESNARFAEVVSAEQDIDVEDPMPLPCLHAFTALWKDEGVQVAIDKGNEYALHDNLTYFFADIDRLFAKDYLPSDQDILRARLRTTGISETIFETDNLIYRMFDVGGQRSERKKWIHVFENVNVVLFLVAISGYDHALVEDRNGNQMREALTLFDYISNSKYFDRSALILFLNKIDIFESKITSGTAPIRQNFPDYKGDDKDIEAGQEFFAQKFRALVKNQAKETYVHYTNATDTSLLDKTMKSVQDMIVQRNLHQLMFDANEHHF